MLDESNQQLNLTVYCGSSAKERREGGVKSENRFGF